MFYDGGMMAMNPGVLDRRYLQAGARLERGGTADNMDLLWSVVKLHPWQRAFND